MGTWGAGNFDDDTAADHLSMIAQRLTDEIAAAMADPAQLEPDEFWGVAVPCNVELLALFAEQRWVGALVPPVATLTEWKASYLEVWDARIDGLMPSPGFKAKRRATLIKTFDRLLGCARREARAAAPPLSAAAKTGASRGKSKKAAT